MSTIYITGHRNPDMDSVCASYAYAVLKNHIDQENQYVAVRCGHLTEAVKKHFENLSVVPPVYMRDVNPKVSDVMNTSDFKLKSKDPIYELVRSYDQSHPSVYPVFDGESFVGLISVDDITAWFLSDNSAKEPVYNFTPDNIVKVLPGEIIQEGKSCAFEASLLVGAAAIEDFKEHLSSNSNFVVVMGKRPKHIEFAIQSEVPAIIISASTDVSGLNFEHYNGFVYRTELGTAETIRRLRMSVEISSLLRKQGPSVQVSDFFDDAKELLISSHFRGLSVYDGQTWKGYVTRRCFLSKPKYRVILVDHNEIDQSIKGIDTAEVKEIIDHHRLDALKTSQPIFIDAEPLGSTCTIVYQQFIRNNLVPDKDTAKVLLSGIIADTLILKSPTTTSTDRLSAGALGAICGIFNLQEFGEKMFSLTASLSNTEPEKAIRSDFKCYRESGIRIGIGQCEATTLDNYGQYSNNYLKTLESIRKTDGLDWAMLMITDVLREKSLLLTTDYKKVSKLPYSKLESNILLMPGVMSRKKQLLTEVIHSLEQ